MQKVTMYRVDVVGGDRSVYLPKLSEARLFAAGHPELNFNEVTGKVEITSKPQLSMMLCSDWVAEREVGSFLHKMGYAVEGRYE